MGLEVEPGGGSWGGGDSHQLRKPPAWEPDAALTVLFTAPIEEPALQQQSWGVEGEEGPREQLL